MSTAIFIRSLPRPSGSRQLGNQLLSIRNFLLGAEIITTRKSAGQENKHTQNYPNLSTHKLTPFQVFCNTDLLYFLNPIEHRQVCQEYFDTFDGAQPRFLNRGKEHRSVSTLSIPRASDRGVEWVDFYCFTLCSMRFALCRVNLWKDFFVQIVNVSILSSRRGGDAIAVP